MYRGIELSASLMCIDWLNVGSQLQQLEEADIDYLHLDLIDGRFAPDFCLGSSIIDAVMDKTTMKADYHLMVEEPSSVFDTFQKRPNDYFVIHQEACRNLHRDLMRLKNQNKGLKVGVALSPATMPENLEYVIENIDVVLLMTVNPGYKGQPLVPQMIRKIAKLKEIIVKMGLDIKISVDGHVGKDVIPDMVASGADILVLGTSGLFRKDMTIKQAVDIVHESIDKGLEAR